MRQHIRTRARGGASQGRGTAHRPRWAGTALFVAACLTSACGSSARDSGARARPDSVIAPGAGDVGGVPRVSGVPTGVGLTACSMEGDWTPCALEERLQRAGVVIEKQEEPAQYPFFSVPGVRYHVGNAEHELLVFLYPSAAARERDTALLDSATVSPPGERVGWRAPPTLVVSNNLAAVILSLNDRTVERLTLALAAGLPQPEKP